MPSVNDIIRVQTEIAEAAADATARFGGALIVTKLSDPLAASGTNKIGHYANLTSVASDGFPTTSEPYRAAQAYFGQRPAPSRLSIARWATGHEPSELIGGTHGTVASMTATATRIISGTGAATRDIAAGTNTLIGVGGATITLENGTGRTAAAIAADIQAKYRAQTFDGASDITVTVVGSAANTQFVITVPAGVSISAGGLTGTAKDVLEFDAGDNPQYQANFRMAVGDAVDVWVELSTTGGALITALSAIATNLEAALKVPLAAATPPSDYRTSLDVQYNATANRFEISDGSSSGTAPAHLTPATGALAQAMGLTAEAGAEVHTGADAAESASDFLAEVAALSDNWYWVILERGIYDDADDADAFSLAVEATRKQLVLDTTSDAVLTNTAGDTAVDIAAAGRYRTTIIWSATADYKAAALAGQFAARDLNRPGTALTAKFRPLTGRAPDTLAPAQITALNNQRINFYTEFGGAAILAEGVATAEGRFIETQQWIDWFTHEVQTEIYDLLRSSNRVPQTLAGTAQLSDLVVDVCRRGIANGGIAPGEVSADVTAAIRTEANLPDFDGELHNGYLTYIAPVSMLTEAQRAAGSVPPIRVWVKGSGAVHFVDLDLTFGG